MTASAIFSTSPINNSCLRVPVTSQIEFFVLTWIEWNWHPQGCITADDLYVCTEQRYETAIELGVDAAWKAHLSVKRLVNSPQPSHLPSNNFFRFSTDDHTGIADWITAHVPDTSTAHLRVIAIVVCPSESVGECATDQTQLSQRAAVSNFLNIECLGMVTVH